MRGSPARADPLERGVVDVVVALEQRRAGGELRREQLPEGRLRPPERLRRPRGVIRLH